MGKLFCRCRFSLEEEKRQRVHYSLGGQLEDSAGFTRRSIKEKDAREAAQTNKVT